MCILFHQRSAPKKGGGKIYGLSIKKSRKISWLAAACAGSSEEDEIIIKFLEELPAVKNRLVLHYEEVSGGEGCLISSLKTKLLVVILKLEKNWKNKLCHEMVGTKQNFINPPEIKNTITTMSRLERISRNVRFAPTASRVPRPPLPPTISLPPPGPSIRSPPPSEEEIAELLRLYHAGKEREEELEDALRRITHEYNSCRTSGDNMANRLNQIPYLQEQLEQAQRTIAKLKSSKMHTEYEYALEVATEQQKKILGLQEEVKKMKAEEKQKIEDIREYYSRPLVATMARTSGIGGYTGPLEYFRVGNPGDQRTRSTRSS